MVEVGNEGTRRGHQALCGPRWKQGGQCLAGRTGFHPSLNTETLAMASGRGRGRQGPAASSEGGVVSDLADDGQHQTGRSGRKFPLYYSCQGKTRPSLQVRKAGDRALVKDTLSRMALGPGGRTGKALARELPATLQGRKGSEKRSILLLGPRETKHPFLYGFSLTSSG